MKNFVLVDEFRRQRGRPLRVLHIGNIANNAYNNAKLQRRVGIEADVVCYGYYHVMGCPEWEDAAFEGEVDEFYPDWQSVDLKGFKRPRWFVQGPIDGCIAYLSARQRGSVFKAWWHWHGLAISYRQLLEEVGRAPRSSQLALDPNLISRRLLESTNFISRRFLETMIFVCHRLVAKVILISRRLMAKISATRVGLWTYAYRMIFAPAEAAAAKGVLSPSVSARVRLLAGWRKLKGWRRRAGKAKMMRPEGPEPILPEMPEPMSPVAAFYDQIFPAQSREQRAADLGYAAGLSSRWAEVLRYYDIVQGYATDGLIPLYNGVRNFASYEHGTLREVPFENSTQGRLCNITYRASPIVFVTNSDVLPSVERLLIPKDRVVCLPHAFNDKKVAGFAAQNILVSPFTDVPVTFFAPARQHWRDGSVSWAKGNDLVIRAAAMLRNEGHRIKLRLVAWGADLELSQRLVEELNCEAVVEWLPVMRKQQLWQHYLEAHAVIDQFVVPALGGVAFEAMCLGRRVITRIDDETLQHFFGKVPPVLNAATRDEIADQMRSVVADPLDQTGRGHAAKAWIHTWHSAERIINLQLTAYDRLLIESAEVVRQ
jgi:hypothetical protein